MRIRSGRHKEKGMGLFRKLFGSGGPSPYQPEVAHHDDQPPWRPGTRIEVQVYEGRTGLEVVGESHYQDALWRLVGSTPGHDRVLVDVYGVLVAESDNEYDPNAVSVWISGLRIGYLSREDAQRYRPGLLALERKHGKPIALPGVIGGGGMRADGLGRLGVFLRHDPSDFGLSASMPPPPPESMMRTGLAGALLTDEIDDSYDLEWMEGVPEDAVGAITKLRQLLEQERDPIDRHFMFHELERALYRSRDTFTSALDEYDTACRQHDAEMDGIREAFVTKWGKVPLLETYKQMCIRQQKAKDFEQALWWAERGIAVYGVDAARPEAVEDLGKRAETYRGKLGR
jgi:hypothetical protein